MFLIVVSCILVPQFIIMTQMEDKALQTIQDAISSHGILASSMDVDNYLRVWSRDSVMAGLVGLEYQDEDIILAFQQSVLTLANHQNIKGIIPSNVAIGKHQEAKVSYGTLVGRTDATTWWVIGTIILLTSRKAFRKKYCDFLVPKILNALEVLHIWEYNDRGLIYSPLGGNWADEYVTSGYTLYDNVLYLWALELSAQYFNDAKLVEKSQKLRQLIINNFDNQIDGQDAEYYHPIAVEKRKSNLKPYFSASLSSNGYDQRWDMAGNAIALYLGLFSNILPLVQFLGEIRLQYSSGLIPVFYPIIEPQDIEWKLLEENYSFKFKNQPFQFHNGGFWPIFGGWLCRGLKKYRHEDLAEDILSSYSKFLIDEDCKFYEYHDVRTGEGKGTQKLCFSAAGFLLMSNNNTA